MRGNIVFSLFLFQGSNHETYHLLEPRKEGGYTVYVPSFRGCISQGETLEEAIANIKEAIELYLEADSIN